jgi:hypothetical protein
VSSPTLSQCTRACRFLSQVVSTCPVKLGPSIAPQSCVDLHHHDAVPRGASDAQSNQSGPRPSPQAQTISFRLNERAVRNCSLCSSQPASGHLSSHYNLPDDQANCRNKYAQYSNGSRLGHSYKSISLLHGDSSHANHIF